MAYFTSYFQSSYFDATASGTHYFTNYYTSYFDADGVDAYHAFTCYFTPYFDTACEWPAVATDAQPSGGYIARNVRNAERQRARARRRRRELEDEADRLELALVAEKLLPPNPEVEARHTVREYAVQAKDFSRRTQRAIDYAERAQTALAYQMALRQVRKEIEDEETALLTLLAYVA